MAKTLPPKLQVWVEARQKHNLSHEQIQMARELGLNPKKFGKLDNHKQELWKVPLPQFIEKIYFKHFKKDRPVAVKSIEQMHAEQLKKKQNKALRKAEKLRNQSTGSPLEVKHMLYEEKAIAKAMDEAKKQLMKEARKKKTEQSNEQQTETTKI